MIKKIVLYGAECSGKTTLAKQLATHYQTSWSPEYVREFVDKKFEKRLPQKGETLVEAEELEKILEGQLSSEKEAIKKAHGLVFLDTNLFVSKIYIEILFEKQIQRLEKLLSQRTYDMYLLLLPDLPYVADYQRDNSESRARFFKIFKQKLQENNLPFVEIGGLGTQRLENAIKAIDDFIKKQ